MSGSATKANSPCSDRSAKKIISSARLVQLGIRKSRFFGRRKTEFQLQMAAAVANLTLVWNAAAKRAKASSPSLVSSGSQQAHKWLLGLQKQVLSGFGATNWILAEFAISSGLDPRILAPR